MPRTPRSPQEKKALSLAHDRRNTFGESTKGARKSIPRNKRLVNQANRQADAQPLRDLRGAVSEDDADRAENRIKGTPRKRWSKLADAPLGLVIEAKQKRREASQGAKKRRRARAAAQKTQK